MLRVRDLMAANVFTLAPEDTLRSAAAKLAEAGVGGAPVVRSGWVVGVLSRADILAFVAERHPCKEEVAEHAVGWIFGAWEEADANRPDGVVDQDALVTDALDTHTVLDVMSAPAFTIDPDALVKEAAMIMAREGVHRLIVSDDDTPVGILTTWDLVCAVAHGGLIPREDAAPVGIE